LVKAKYVNLFFTQVGFLIIPYPSP